MDKNVTIYVCSPLFKDEQNKFEIEEKLKKLLATSYEISEILVKQSNEHCVYVVGEHKKRFTSENLIRNKIITAFQSVFGERVSEPDVKLNVGEFLPAHVTCQESESPQKSIGANDQSTAAKTGRGNVSEEFDYNKLSLNYQAEVPKYSFNQVRLVGETQRHIMEAVGILEVEEKVFDEWGLRSIIPEAASALSFYGPPGTGKTMAAHAVADYLGKKILLATYADIESKFYGEGPKMVKAIFKAAERENAVLFLDESDSLLSKRLTNVSEGSSQAINSMRSQLLVSLENFRGVVIFATNLVVNYDKAFLSRLINVEFLMPDSEIRKDIWMNHVKSDKIRIPLAEDVDLDSLSEKYEFSGREIKNAVKNACVSAALQKRDIVLHDDFVQACDRVESETEKAVTARDHAAMQKTGQQTVLKDAFQKVLDKNGQETKVTDD